MQVELSPTPDLRLTRAILIYSSSRDDAAATDHNVVGGEIQPGRPLDLSAFRDELSRMKDAGSRESSSSFVFTAARYIAESRDFRVWWTAPGKVRLFIAGKAKRCWLPAMVWCAHLKQRVCYMWGFDSGTVVTNTKLHEAPKTDTILYHLRFGPVDGTNHIHHDDQLCIGNGDPKGCTPAEWEAMFYDTSFKTKDGLPAKPYDVKTLTEVGTLKDQLARIQPYRG